MDILNLDAAYVWVPYISPAQHCYAEWSCSSDTAFWL